MESGLPTGGQGRKQGGQAGAVGVIQVRDSGGLAQVTDVQMTSSAWALTTF